jgi:hypothetical protein
VEIELLKECELDNVDVEDVEVKGVEELKRLKTLMTSKK